MEFRHFFIQCKFMDRIYMNIIRPLGYFALIFPREILSLCCHKRQFSYLKEFKDKYKGKRCFIVGTGPSLTPEDLELIKNEFVIGVNSLCLWKKYLKYINFFFIGDTAAYRRLHNDLPVGTFVSNHCLSICRDLDEKGFQKIPVSRFNYFIPYTHKFSQDISNVFFDFNSVVFLAIQFAVYAGFSEIYLLGVDCNYNLPQIYAIDHGIRHRKEYMESVGIDMIHNFKFVKKYIMRKHIPVQIYNASSGGMLEVFPRVKLKDLCTGEMDHEKDNIFTHKS